MRSCITVVLLEDHSNELNITDGPSTPCRVHKNDGAGRMVSEVILDNAGGFLKTLVIPKLLNLLIFHVFRTLHILSAIL